MGTTQPAHRFGDVAVEKGFITHEQLAEALVRQRTLGVPVGEALVELGFVTASQVAAILKLQRLLVNQAERIALGEAEAKETLLGQILGRCLLLDMLGRGAMGTTYKAHHLRLDRDVCVKVLKADLCRDKRTKARFVREARAAAKLEHPAIVSVYDFDEEGAYTFIVMQLVDGKSLKDVLDERGPLGPKRATFVAGRIAEALASAHQEKIVHRDVKPANVLVSKKGAIKLTDFGLVRVIDPGAVGVNTSAVGELIGTPSYMSPEQAQAAPEIDGRSDVYSLGVMTFELACGRLPYQASSLIGLLKKHMLEPLPSLKALRDDAPPALDDLLRRLCAKDPERRPDAATASRELRHLLQTAFGSDSAVEVPLAPTARLGAPSAVAAAAGVSPTSVKAASAPAFSSKREVLAVATDKLVARALAGELDDALKQVRRLAPAVAREVALRVISSLAAAGRHAEIVGARAPLLEAAGASSEVLILLARAQQATGAPDAAAASLEAALAGAPGDVELVLELAQLRASLGDKDEARRLVETLLAQRPADALAHRKAAEVRYVVLGDLEGAEQAYGRAADLDRDAFEPRQQQGFLLLELGRPAEAQKALEDAIARSPDASIAHELLGRARLAKGDLAGARAALRRAIVLDPTSTGARSALLDEAERGQRWDEVARLAQDGLARTPDDQGLLHAFARARELQGDRVAAARVLGNILERHPEDARAREALERIRGHLGV